MLKLLNSFMFLSALLVQSSSLKAQEGPKLDICLDIQKINNSSDDESDLKKLINKYKGKGIVLNADFEKHQNNVQSFSDTRLIDQSVDNKLNKYRPLIKTNYEVDSVSFDSGNLFSKYNLESVTRNFEEDAKEIIANAPLKAISLSLYSSSKSESKISGIEGKYALPIVKLSQIVDLIDKEDFLSKCNEVLKPGQEIEGLNLKKDIDSILAEENLNSVDTLLEALAREKNPSDFSPLCPLSANDESEYNEYSSICSANGDPIKEVGELNAVINALSWPATKKSSLELVSFKGKQEFCSKCFQKRVVGIFDKGNNISLFNEIDSTLAKKNKGLVRKIAKSPNNEKLFSKLNEKAELEIITELKSEKMRKTLHSLDELYQALSTNKSLSASGSSERALKNSINCFDDEKLETQLKACQNKRDAKKNLREILTQLTGSKTKHISDIQWRFDKAINQETESTMCRQGSKESRKDAFIQKKFLSDKNKRLPEAVSFLLDQIDLTEEELANPDIPLLDKIVEKLAAQSGESMVSGRSSIIAELFKEDSRGKVLINGKYDYPEEGEKRPINSMLDIIRNDPNVKEIAALKNFSFSDEKTDHTVINESIKKSSYIKTYFKALLQRAARYNPNFQAILNDKDTAAKFLSAPLEEKLSQSLDITEADEARKLQLFKNYQNAQCDDFREKVKDIACASDDEILSEATPEDIENASKIYIENNFNNDQLDQEESVAALSIATSTCKLKNQASESTSLSKRRKIAGPITSSEDFHRNINTAFRGDKSKNKQESEFDGFLAEGNCDSNKQVEKYIKNLANNEYIPPLDLIEVTKGLDKIQQDIGSSETLSKGIESAKVETSNSRYYQSNNYNFNRIANHSTNQTHNDETWTDYEKELYKETMGGNIEDEGVVIRIPRKTPVESLDKSINLSNSTYNQENEESVKKEFETVSEVNVDQNANILPEQNNLTALNQNYIPPTEQIIQPISSLNSYSDFSDSRITQVSNDYSKSEEFKDDMNKIKTEAASLPPTEASSLLTNKMKDLEQKIADLQQSRLKEIEDLEKIKEEEKEEKNQEIKNENISLKEKLAALKERSKTSSENLLNNKINNRAIASVQPKIMPKRLASNNVIQNTSSVTQKSRPTTAPTQVEPRSYTVGPKYIAPQVNSRLDLNLLTLPSSQNQNQTKNKVNLSAKDGQQYIIITSDSGKELKKININEIELDEIKAINNAYKESNIEMTQDAIDELLSLEVHGGEKALEELSPKNPSQKLTKVELEIANARTRLKGLKSIFTQYRDL